MPFGTISEQAKNSCRPERGKRACKFKLSLTLLTLRLFFRLACRFVLRRRRLRRTFMLRLRLWCSLMLRFRRSFVLRLSLRRSLMLRFRRGFVLRLSLRRSLVRCLRSSLMRCGLRCCFLLRRSFMRSLRRSFRRMRRLVRCSLRRALGFARSAFFLRLFAFRFMRRRMCSRLRFALRARRVLTCCGLGLRACGLVLIRCGGVRMFAFAFRWRSRMSWGVLCSSSSCWLLASGVFSCTLICGAVTRRALIRSGSFRWNDSCFEVSRFRRRRYRRLSMVYGRKLAAIVSSQLAVRHLHRRRRRVLLVCEGFFLCCRSPADAAWTVKARASRRVIVIDHRFVVNIVNYGHIHVIHRAIVEEMIPFPAPAFISFSYIPESVVNSAIETDVRSPVSAVPRIHSAVPSPISRRPEKSRSRRLRPSARHPIIIAVVIAPSPIAGRPYISLAGKNWLHVHRQRGRSYSDRYRDLSVRYSRCE